MRITVGIVSLAVIATMICCVMCGTCASAASMLDESEQISVLGGCFDGERCTAVYYGCIDFDCRSAWNEEWQAYIYLKAVGYLLPRCAGEIEAWYTCPRVENVCVEWWSGDMNCSVHVGNSNMLDSCGD